LEDGGVVPPQGEREGGREGGRVGMSDRAGKSEKDDMKYFEKERENIRPLEGQKEEGKKERREGGREGGEEGLTGWSRR